MKKNVFNLKAQGTSISTYITMNKNYAQPHFMFIIVFVLHTILYRLTNLQTLYLTLQYKNIILYAVKENPFHFKIVYVFRFCVLLLLHGIHSSTLYGIYYYFI